MFTNEFEFDSTITTVIVSPIGFGARSGRGAAEVSVCFFFRDGFGWGIGGTMGPTILKECIRHKSAHAASKGASQPTAALAMASEEAGGGGGGNR